MQITPLTLRFPDRTTLRVVTAALLLAGLLVLIMVLVFNVRSRLTAMEQVGSDNGQWVMMQTEVEVLRLRSAVGNALARPSGQGEIRRWFDVVVSRVAMLENSPVYRDFMQDAENKALLLDLQGFVARWLPVMDGAPATLAASLPELERDVVAAQRIARRLSLLALLNFTASTDQTRAGIDETLTLLAITTGVTLLGLGLLGLMWLRVVQTTRRQSQEHQVTSTRLQMIIATSPDAIVVTNRGGWVVEFNPAAEDIFGIPRDDILGKQAVSVIFPPAVQAASQTVISDAISKAVTQGPQRLEMEGIRADGSRFPLELSIAVRDLSAGALVVAFMRDISARKLSNAALQTALTKAQASERAKANFIAVMSHEMRTPLNGLLGSMVLMRDTQLDVEQRELLRVMRVSGEVLLGHVNSVLDVSMAEAGAGKPQSMAHGFDLDQLIEDCVASQTGLAQAAGTTLSHVALTGSFGAVLGDSGRLRQVLLNLIGNAVKFTKGGTVTVESERLPRPRPGDKDWVEMRVVDTGIGIAADDLDRVFEDFETADPSYGRVAGGTGLGLGIARRLVTAMGGQIGVESELGAGSVFWVRLPLPTLGPVVTARTVPPGQIDLPAQAPTLRHRGPPLSVLIIEDNDINRFVLRRYLEVDGHEVFEAVDGLDGVTQATARAFDLIITDIAMPRMDGIEAARRIRASAGPSSKARILALTAHVLGDQVAGLDAAGIDACLTKPVARSVLLAQLPGRAPRSTAPVPPPLVVPLIDPAPLDEMRAVMDAGVVAQMITRLMDEGDRVLSPLTTGMASDAVDGRIIHQMAGACATFGAIRLRLALAEMEQALQDGNSARTGELRASLPALWAETRAALQAQAALTTA